MIGKQAVPIYFLSTNNKVTKDIQFYVYFSLNLAADN